ncbi:hypothetical protein A2774_01685 [Candidatus Roizmanbacteria bacterium RIFCSPHIGHO2_01_FULL_39_12c]|uniref:Uncharacterized protein n=1 Tax=Candidatus Roizmanbacteria bacterium RIFCSPHIGHO2_01_FULL_39_12c TaxID=1802031 RepID=A0A1F7GB26_9BACT|nr:MAG: hypothetical protein A2774_01685 [Candidatus Roizmanbacteria bacterium RIFCSPHIGHO2_01_FULL_39_12c]OGK46904.1 MAG: hypothetical protein A2963_05095 [Candidatus Roizmanbacteria bacterium RIFCSPLOWO2_01_FULL_40_13]
MQKNLRAYFDFSSDLKRTIKCLVNKNSKTAAVFFQHADKIYREKIHPSINEKYFPPQLQKSWLELSRQKLISDPEKQLLVADKILTIATIIFKRTFHYAVN